MTQRFRAIFWPVFLVVSIITAYFLLSGCTQNKVSFDTVEDARRQARENVTVIAQTFRAENKLTEYDIMVRGDSTQSAECPQGDGWATIDLIDRKTNSGVKLKCSTVSATIGCLEESDFKTKRYAAEDGKCNNEIPFPLPKLSK